MENIHRDIIIVDSVGCLAFCLNHFGYLPNEFNDELAAQVYAANLLTLNGKLRAKFKTTGDIIRRLAMVA